MKRVLLGISGGIDSAVALKLLQDEGYDVTAYTFLNNYNKAKIAAEASRVAEFFGVKHVIEDVSRDFAAGIEDYFIETYAQGRTPNPCCMCNRLIKLPKLIAKSQELGMNYAATGHYVKTDGSYIRKGADAKKDQSYFLGLVPKDNLKSLLFPLGVYTKDEVKKIGKELGLPQSEGGESQDICFIPDNDFGSYLQKHRPSLLKDGEIKDIHGRVLGTHKGIAFYTLGQRRGLGISSTEPLYVKGLDKDTNSVILAPEAELYSSSCILTDVNFFGSWEDGEYDIKIRYKSKSVKAEINSVTDGTLRVCFREPVKAVTPGQLGAVYNTDDKLTAAGIIGF